MNRYDFLVVGGGPAGCRAAYKLAKAGHQVAVLEKSPSVGDPVCCTGIVSRECIERFSLPSELILRELKSASVFSPEGHTLRIERTETQAALIDRGPFNAYMARRAQDEGVDYFLAHNVTDIHINPDCVIATAERRGERFMFQARAVVLACGFGSKLPENLGFARPRDWAAGVQVEVEALDLSEVEIYPGEKRAPGYFAWLVPSSGSAALAGLMTRKDADRHLGEFVRFLRSSGKIKPVSAKPKYRGITLHPPRRSYSDRVLLVGDAAGQVKPLTGGGIYFGLLCADMAADVLHTSMESGDFSSRELSAYQKEWKKLLGRELMLGRLAHSLYAQFGEKRLEWLLGRAKIKGMPARLAASPAIGFDWHGSAMLQVMKHAAWPFTKGRRLNPADNEKMEVRPNV